LTATAISVIVAIIGFLLFGWLRSKQGQVDAVENKNEALEAAAEKERQEDAAEDEAEADEIVRAGDRKRAIGFLRDSFGKDSD
jgi:DNA-binding protein H-NS